MVNGGLHLQYSKLHIAEFQDIYFLEWILAGVYIGVSLGAWWLVYKKCPLSTTCCCCCVTWERGKNPQPNNSLNPGRAFPQDVTINREFNVVLLAFNIAYFTQINLENV